MPVFTRRLNLPVPAASAFAWHERSGAFERLTPPWEKVRVLEASGGIRDGDRVRVQVHAFGPLSFEAVYRHVDYEEGKRFVDLQEKGPFREWRHEHRFEALAPDSCILEDRIEYEPPPLGGAFVRRRLDRMFRYRHTVTLGDLMHEATVGPVRPKTVLVSGASGLVGRALCARLTTRGHVVRRLSRGEGPDQWDPARGRLDPGLMDEVDVVVHLAGESVVQRWTASAKERILRSRVGGAELLVRAILTSGREIAYVSASGANFYGSQKSGVLTEDKASGDGFLARVCREWEAAADGLREAGLRTAFLRTGIVLSPEGGALGAMLPVFRFGLGGRIASGGQFMSWISLDDLVEMYLRAVEDPDCTGPLNAVAPEAIENRSFTKTLARVLRRPAVFPVPGCLIRAGLGEMGRETLLSDLALRPDAFAKLGQGWRHSGLEEALRHGLGREEGVA